MADEGAAPRRSITVADLSSWEDSGATWRTVALSDQHAVVELCTCYGEPVDLLETTAPEVIEFLRDHGAR